MATMVGMEDPATQEKIRRGSHEYLPMAGKHGSYVPKPYAFQEYPKVMDRTPAPVRSNFKSDVEFEQARSAWDYASTRSIVRSREEEEAWLAKHAPAAEAAKAAPEAATVTVVTPATKKAKAS